MTPERAEEIASRIRADYAISMGAKAAIKQAILLACAEERAEKAEAELSAAKKKYLQVCAQHGRLVDQVYEEDGETLKQRELAAYKMWAEVEIADLRDDVKWMSECEERALAAEKDAGRYRWLRDKSVPPHNFYLSVPVEFDGIRYTPQEVDAAIDAAIGAKHEG